MRKFMLMAGAAAMAAAMPVLAKEQGQGRGKGRGGEAAQAQKGGGNDERRAERRGRGGDDRRAERRGRGNDDRRAERRGPSNDDQRAERRGRGNDDRRAERRGRGGDDRRAERRERGDVRETRREDRRDFREARRIDHRDWRGWAERRIDRRGDRRVRFSAGRDCPPGLARQNAFCMPPGQLRKARLIGQRLPISSRAYNIPDRYRYRFSDGDRYYHRWDDGVVYRFDRSSNLVQSVIPVYATNLFVGEPMPLGYQIYNVPLQYRDYYPDSSDYLYRYDDNAIYRVNSESMLVEGIVALLTGGGGGLGDLAGLGGGLGGLGGLGSLAGLGGLGIGDTLPAGYDAYNVPLDYRDTYYDSPDSMYRYADGSIYQVDPQTRLIESVISLLT